MAGKGENPHQRHRRAEKALAEKKKCIAEKKKANAPVSVSHVVINNYT